MKTKGSNESLKFKLGNFCYLGGTVAKNNSLTIHEIYPRRLGGQRVYVNTALLCRLEHDMNNVIELQKPKFALELSDYYHYIRETRDIDALNQMRIEVLQLIDRLGYVIEDKGKILSLRRNNYGNKILHEA